MFVIEVIPFSRGASLGALSYRSRELLSAGTIVSIPIRNKIVMGIVVACVPVREAKSALKRASFSLRAGVLSTKGQLPTDYSVAIADIATYYALPLSIMYRTVLPEVFLSNTFPTEFAKGVGKKVSYIEAPYKKRIETYRSYISRSKGTVLIVAPTTVEVTRLARIFSGAIVLTGELTAKRRQQALSSVQGASVVITTPSYSFVPIANISRIILERESASSWLGIAFPKLDWREALHALARARCIPITLGDYPLRLDVRPTGGAPLSSLLHTPIEIIDRSKSKKKTAAVQHRFTAIPPLLMQELKHAVAHNERGVIITLRKGYAPAVVCRDCGTTVRDVRGRALSLVGVGTHRVLRSADGNTLRSAEALCDLCGSWNLLPLGVGIERVVEELEKTFPDTPFIRFDADTVKTPAAARRAAKEFDTPGAIVIGTESVLPWLNPDKPFQLSAIISADTLLALPFWRSRERLVRLALTLGQLSEKEFIATRRPDDTVFSALSTHSMEEFFTEENSLHKSLHYPPYGHILVLRITATSIERLNEGEALVRLIMKTYTVTRLPDRHTTKQSTVRTCIIKVPQDKWPDKALSAHISQLPSWIAFSIDSESMW